MWTSSCRNIFVCVSSFDGTLATPNLVDDYHLNLLDWDSSNILVVALGGTVYLWDVSVGSTSDLVVLEDESSPATISTSYNEVHDSFDAVGFMLFYVGLHLEYKKFHHYPLQNLLFKYWKQTHQSIQSETGDMGVMSHHKCKEGKPEYRLPNRETSSGESLFLSNVTELKSREWIFGLRGKAEVESSPMIPPFLLLFFLLLLLFCFVCLWES